MSRVAWILNASIYGFLGLNSARIVAILGAQGLAHNKHSRRALMKRYCERRLELYRRLVAIQAYSVGVAFEDRLFVGVYEVADESRGKLARRVVLTQRSGDILLECDGCTAAADGEMKLEFLGG
jgi:hypothetical protein